MDISWNMNTRGTVCDTRINDFRISVHRHINDKDTWFVSCGRIEMDTVSLDTNDLEEAKLKALYTVIEKLESYEGFIDQLNAYLYGI